MGSKQRVESVKWLLLKLHVPDQSCQRDTVNGTDRGVPLRSLDRLLSYGAHEVQIPYVPVKTNVMHGLNPLSSDLDTRGNFGGR
jgi:hypothetical protein